MHFVLLSFMAVIASANPNLHTAAAAPDTQAPRTSYWCAGLLQVGQRLRGADQRWLIHDLWRAKEKLTTEARAIRRIELVIHQLKSGQPNHTPVAQIVVGAENIRQHLNTVEENARRLEAEHPAEDLSASLPPPIRPMRLGRTGLANAAAALVYAGVVAGGLTDALLHGQTQFALGIGAANLSLATITYVTFVRPLWARYVKEAKVGVNDPDLPRSLVAWHEQIRRMLEDGRQDEVYHQGYTLYLPVRTWDRPRGARARTGPTADELIFLARERERAAIPAHARRVHVDQILRHDEILRQPVLISVVSEPEYIQEGW